MPIPKALTGHTPLTSVCLAGALALVAGACSTEESTTPVVVELQPAELGSVKRLHVFGDILLASQPQPADLEQLSEDGFRTVINQRPAKELEEFDERAVVTGLGMTYFNPGWNGPEQLTDEILDETLELMRTAERPLLLHCSSANRSGTTWLAYRVLDDGLSVEQALAEAKTVGMRTPEYEPIVLDYIARRLAGEDETSPSTDEAAR